jgi:hypothetical protein
MESVSFVRADEKLTAFVELEIATSGQRKRKLAQPVFGCHV